MTLLFEYIVFFTYVGMAFLVGLVAILWGSQAKIMGAGILLGAVIVANILYWLSEVGVIDLRQRVVIFVLLDLILAYVFLLIYSRSGKLLRNRWAGFIAFFQLGMATVSMAAMAQPHIARLREYALVLNILFILELTACLIGFAPKSRNEAFGVARLKWLYLMSDLFKRVIAPLRYGRRNKVAENKRGSTVKEIDAHIGAKIREARIIRDLSQEKLAAAIGMSPSQVQKFESGANRVSASALYALSEVLGVDIAFFYKGIEVGANLGAVKNPDSKT